MSNVAAHAVSAADIAIAKATQVQSATAAAAEQLQLLPLVMHST